MPRKPPPAKTPSAKPSAAKGGDDKTLWQHVASSVTPLRARHKKAARDSATATTPSAAPAAPPVKKTAKKTKAEKAATPQRSTLVRTTAPTTPVAAVKKSSGGFDRATETKLRKGQLDIEGRIDLHGMTQDQAWSALTRFVGRAHAQHKRTVLVITGKGRVSQGGGVLRRLLPLWVREGDLAACVLACVPAAIKDGGDGAFYLRLRK